MGIGDIFKIKQFKEQIASLEAENQTLSQNNADLQAATTELRGKLSEIGGFDYYKVKSMTEQMEKQYAVKQRDLSIEYDVKVDTLKKEYERKQAEAEKGLREQLVQLERMISDRTDKSQSLQEKIAEEMLQESKLAKQIKTQTNKLGRSKELVKAINYSLDNFFNYDSAISSLKFSEKDLTDLEEISPSVILKLHPYNGASG